MWRGKNNQLGAEKKEIFDSNKRSYCQTQISPAGRENRENNQFKTGNILH